MKDTTVKLVFAGTMTILGILLAFGTVLVGILRGLDVPEILALGAIFSNVVTAGIVYFLGYSNGRNGATKEHVHAPPS